jgi:hypothetical protein
MSDKLFNAELRDCARYTAEELEMYERLIEDEEGYEWEEVESDDGHYELYDDEPVMDLPNDLFMVFDDPDYWD